jgi:hypothetical protein
LTVSWIEMLPALDRAPISLGASRFRSASNSVKGGRKFIRQVLAR